MRYKLQVIEEMTEDYVESMVLTDNRVFYTEKLYHEIKSNERGIKGTLYDDIYSIVPESIYRIKLDKKLQNDSSYRLTNELAELGLFLFSHNGFYAYVKNISKNIIYLQKGITVIKEV